MKTAGAAAAPPADDSTFLRRINLALAGRVPVPSEAREYLAQTHRGKKAAIDRLLASAAFTNHLTTSWRTWLLPEALTNQEVAGAVPAFEAWLRIRLRENVPLNDIVKELLTVPLGETNASQDPETAARAAGAMAFYTAKEGKPENLAAATSRVFLGVHLECAQCHDHPFARWSRNQFWGMAAFFSGVERPNGGAIREMPGRRELVVPNSDRAVPITFLDDREPEWQYKKSPRVTLAAWVTAPTNPFFAKAMVNRLWWLAFGIGLVEPVDDFHDQNPPSHPELLDALARAFVESGFDSRFILRAICLSDTFGRASLNVQAPNQPARLFGYYPLHGLTPEQLYDSLVVVLGLPPEGPGSAFLQAPASARRQFMEVFASAGKPTEAPTSILQALTLMNGNLVGTATNVESSRLLTGVLRLPDLKSAQRVEALYFAVLSRPPSAKEQERALRHVDGKNRPPNDRLYADLLWALLNSIEFRTIH